MSSKDEAAKQSVSEVTVTPATMWRKQSVDGEFYKLPTSGHVVKLRRPGLQALVGRAGTIPNPVSAEVLRFLSTPRDPLRTYTDKERMEMYERNSKAFAVIAQMCFVEPRVIIDAAVEPDYEHGEIGVWNIADYDLTWLVYAFVEGDADAVAEFRADLDRSNGADRLDSEALRNPTVVDFSNTR